MAHGTWTNDEINAVRCALYHVPQKGHTMTTEQAKALIDKIEVLRAKHRLLMGARERCEDLPRNICISLHLDNSKYDILPMTLEKAKESVELFIEDTEREIKCTLVALNKEDIE